jgi:predicted nucleic acid-binding Zn ribbon protein
MNHASSIAILKAMPRSTGAAIIFFGAGALWFLWIVLHLSAADFGEYRVWLAIGFAAIAVLSFKCVPDFLAVRGLCVLTLLSALPLLGAAYMEYEHPQRLFMVSFVFVLIALAIWLGASPFRLRDFFAWLFAMPSRTRVTGGALVAYGLLLSAVAFTY